MSAPPATDGLHGSDESLGHVAAAIDALLHFQPELETEIGLATASDPTCVMAHALDAYAHLLTTEPADAAAASAAFPMALAGADRAGLTDRERGHVEAIERWLTGDLQGAGDRLRAHTREHPRDVAALAVGHQIDFFTGDAVALRDRIGEALPAWDEEHPHFGLVLGMHAFGLEETGQYERSEDVALRAVTLDERDVWGIHAVAHTYETQGRVDEGVRYLREREAEWAHGNFFSAHNWWHYCLYALEAGQVERALEIYDAELHYPGVDLVAMQMLDAAALLWRLYLEDIDQTARWKELARAWEEKTEPAFYAFNDMHAVMSYVGAGELARAERLVADRRRYVAQVAPAVTNRRMTADIGLPVCEALLAFGQGRYETTVERLLPIRHRINEFGGSHAQRDAVDRTLLEAAIRSGRLELARELTGERLFVRPSSPYNGLKRDQVERAAARARAERGGPGAP